MRRLYPYEILYIIDPRLTEEDAAALLTRLQETLQGLGGEVGGVESWGKRRLTFELRKQREGTYAVMETSATPAALREFERQLKLNEQVLRFMTTRVPARKPAEVVAEGSPAEPGSTAVEPEPAAAPAVEGSA